MDTQSLVALCLAALFSSVVVPWSLAIAYRRSSTRNTPVEEKKVVENANNYRRYHEYTALIFCWALVIVIYIAVLDRAVKHPTFLGPKGSRSRNVSVQVLSFVRTGLAVIHLPLMTTVLAATVPYWTMSKHDRRAPETADPQPENALDEFPRPPKVTKLFYLADKTWSGLIGWTTTFLYGYREGGLSYTWSMLAAVAAMSYLGFPLLSLAYITTSTQYWRPGNISATVRLCGLSEPYSNTLGTTLDISKWMNSQDVLNTNLSSNLVGFNSSIVDVTPFTGIANQSFYFPWADNQTVVTLSPGTVENKQLPLAGIRAFASCGFKNYSVTDSMPVVPNLAIDKVDPDSNGGSPYKLRCANNCSDLGNSSSMACSAQSSVVNLTQLDFEGVAGDHSFVYVGSITESQAESQALSCVHQDSSDLQSVATILLAVQNSNVSTQVATCNLSVTYLRPTVNTLIGSYIKSTGSSSTDIILDASPSQLINLSISSFINFFHQGPPPLTANAPGINCTLPPISSGLSWVSSLKPPCVYDPYNNPIIPRSTSTILATNPDNHADIVHGISTFDERMFLGPLSSLINSPSFFENGTVAGVAFKTEQGVAYGHVPAVLAVLILGIPILCTIALSVITTTQRRWTASLDAFAMFKLGADWHDNVDDQKLVSLGKTSENVKEIPGTVVVNPETGVVELAHPMKRRRLERSERRHGWLSEYTAVDYSYPQGPLAAQSEKGRA